MGNVNEVLEEMMKIDGAIAVCLVDLHTGAALGSLGGSDDLNLKVAAAGNSEVVKAKLKVMANMGVKGHIEDILITLDEQYHLIRPLKKDNSLFIYLVVAKEETNLAMTRHNLASLENNLVV